MKKIIRQSNNFIITQRRHRKPNKRGKGHRYYTIDLVEWFPDDEIEGIRNLLDPTGMISDVNGFRYTFQDLDTAQKKFTLLMLSKYDNFYDNFL